MWLNKNAQCISHINKTSISAGWNRSFTGVTANKGGLATVDDVTQCCLVILWVTLGHSQLPFSAKIAGYKTIDKYITRGVNKDKYIPFGKLASLLEYSTQSHYPAHICS